MKTGISGLKVFETWLDVAEEGGGELVEVVLHLPDPGRLKFPNRLVRNRILVLRFPDVAPLFRRPEHFPGSGEESREGQLQDVDERLEFLGQADQEVLVHWKKLSDVIPGSVGDLQWSVLLKQLQHQ